MKILIIGLGSMGKRRLRLLKKVNKNLQLAGVEKNIIRKTEVKEEWKIPIFDNLKQALSEWKPQCVFLCTSPEIHLQIMNLLLTHDVHTFSEIDLISYSEPSFLEKIKSSKFVHFLSSTPLFNKQIQFIQNQLSANKEYHYRYHIGQHLKDWHPWENYLDFFASQNNTNGCREILAIELPWLINAFGSIIKFEIYKSSLTQLQIQFKDSYQIIVQHSSGSVGSLSVNLATPIAIRYLEIYSENAYISWAGTPDSLKHWDIEQKEIKSTKIYQEVEQRSDYAKMIIENPYEEEINAFFRQIETRVSEFNHSYEKNAVTLKWIDNMEK
jgi:predicted dehydrogenase